MRSVQRDPHQSVESGACTGARLLYLYGALVMAGSLHISLSRGFVQRGGTYRRLPAARALKGESKAGRSSLRQYMSDGYKKKAAVQGDLNWRPQGLAAARHRASF